MHMVFSGIVATLLAKRKRQAPTSPPPTQEAMDAWAIKHLAQGADWGAETAPLRIQRFQGVLRGGVNIRRFR